MRIKNPPQKQLKPPQGLEGALKKLYVNMKYSLQNNVIVQQHELIDLIDMTKQFQSSSIKIITIWKKTNSNYEKWWQFEYQNLTKTLIMSSYFTQNYQMCNINGHFNINLITSLFQRYTKELQLLKQFYQFSINPLSGSVKIISKALTTPDQLRAQIIKPAYLDQLLYNIQAMVKLNDHTIALNQYFHGRIKQCPVPNFVVHPLSYNKRVQISPKTFLKCINTSLNYVDPNCQQIIQTFGHPQNVQQFMKKNQLPFPLQITKIVQSVNSEYYHIPIHKQSPIISQVLNDIYQVSYIDQPYAQAETLAKKIRITTQFTDIEWKPLARGGFGLIEKAYVHYQLFDFGSKVGEQLQGYIVRKSDTKLPKIQHQHRIFSLLKTQYHSNIMPHYIPDQKIYQKYIFSKFQPHMSMDKYIKVNKKTISLQTIIRFMEHTVKGLLFLKQKNIVHLDIKPNNIIITKEFKAKITDFGQAFYLEDEILQHKHGFTVPYIAPQVLQSLPKLNSKVDVYAVGVTLYKVIFGNHLWGDLFDREKFLDQLEKRRQTLILAPQKILKQGMAQITGALTNISLKCINRQQNLRPSLFYISVVLSFCRYYIYSLTEKSKSDETKK